MRDLAIGDNVMTVGRSYGTLEASPVYMMPHAISSGMFPFKHIRLATNHTITASPDHYMLLGDPRWADAWVLRPVPAGAVKVGDRMFVFSKESKKILSTLVIQVDDVYGEGLFAPFTLTGTIISNDVVASVYVRKFGSEAAMHAFCSWVRALWTSSPNLFKSLHSIGWLSPIAMGVAHVVQAVLSINGAVSIIATP